MEKTTYKAFAVKALNEMKAKSLLEARRAFSEAYAKTGLTENDGANFCHPLVNGAIVKELPIATIKKLLPIVDSLEGKKMELHRVQQKMVMRLREHLNMKAGTFDKKEFQALMKKALETKAKASPKASKAPATEVTEVTEAI